MSPVSTTPHAKALYRAIILRTSHTERDRLRLPVVQVPLIFNQTYALCANVRADKQSIKRASAIIRRYHGTLRREAHVRPQPRCFPRMQPCEIARKFRYLDPRTRSWSRPWSARGHPSACACHDIEIPPIHSTEVLLGFLRGIPIAARSIISLRWDSTLARSMFNASAEAFNRYTDSAPPTLAFGTASNCPAATAEPPATTAY